MTLNEIFEEQNNWFCTELVYIEEEEEEKKKRRKKKKDDDDDDAAYKQDHSSIRVTFYKIDVTNKSKLNS